MSLLSRRTVLAGATAAVTRAARADDITLRFLFSQPVDTYDPAIAEFEKRNPGIRIARQQVPFDQLNAQIQSRLGSQDSSLDVFGADEPRIPAFVHRHFLEDLSALLPALKSVADAASVDATSWEGKLWALPLWTSTQLLYYNKALLEKAGIAPPAADPKQRLTWEALVPMARKARQAGAKFGFSFDQVDRYYELQPLYESAGAGPGLTGPGLMTPTITTPKWVEVTQWYGSLYADGTAPRGVAYEQIPSLFAGGEIAFLVGGPWNLPVFERQGGAAFGIAPMPYFAQGKPVTPTGSWSLGVNPYGRNKDAALKFARFLTLDKDGALLSTAKLPLPPANQAASVPYYQHQTAAGGDATAHFTDIVQHELRNTAVGRPRTIGYVAFEEIMNKMFSDVRNGSEAARRLAAAQDALKSAFSRIR